MKRKDWSIRIVGIVCLIIALAADYMVNERFVIMWILAAVSRPIRI